MNTYLYDITGVFMQKKCPICDYSSGRLTILSRHVINSHDFLNLKDAYTHSYCNGINGLCKCGCNLETTWTWKNGYALFIKGHNGNLDKIYSPERVAEIKKLRKDKQTGQVGWAKGLTKETSDVIKRRTELSCKRLKEMSSAGQINCWSKGLTKETSQILKDKGDKSHTRFVNNEITAWHKGKSKETCDSLMKMSNSIKLSLSFKQSLSKRIENQRLSKDEIINRLNLNAFNLELISNIDQYTRDKHNSLTFKCKLCGDTRIRSLISALTNRCFTCNPSGSNDQISIWNFVKSIGISSSISDRIAIAPYEIDIFMRDNQIGIEYNGLYFHSENFKDNKYHEKKSRLCERNNIQLLHIFEDEWRDKKEIIKSIISYKLGVVSTKINARECRVKEVSTKERRDFFNQCHIDGDTRAIKAFGLFDKNNNLVSCLSIRTPRNKKYNGMIEVARHASLLNTSVRGGLSKLFKSVKNWAINENYTSIMTYVDTRLGNGKGYISSGFTQVNRTIPRWWWTDDVNRFDRFTYRANKKLNMTESQVANAAGVKKIYGCSNLIMTLNLL